MISRTPPFAALAFFAVPLLAAPAFAQRATGIDVSEFQGTMNWNTAYAAGARFAFIRVGRGGTTAAEGHEVDANYVTNFANAANAKSGGVPVTIYTGPYLRARPDLSELTDAHAGSSDDQPAAAALMARARDEAQNLYNLSQPYLTPQHLRPVLDLENIPSDVPQHPGTEPLTAANMTLWANTFLDQFQTLSGGIEPIVYVNTDYATNRLTSGINSPRRRTLWLARPYSGTYSNSSQPETPSGYPNPYGQWNIAADPNSSWNFWQYDSTGNGATYGASSANLDVDTFNGSVTQLQAFLIPEPASAAIAGTGAVILAARRRPRTVKAPATIG